MSSIETKLTLDFRREISGFPLHFITVRVLQEQHLVAAFRTLSHKLELEVWSLEDVAGYQGSWEGLMNVHYGKRRIQCFW